MPEKTQDDARGASRVKKPFRSTKKNVEQARMLGGKSVRSIQQREADYAFIARYMCRGLAPWAILEQLHKERPYQISAPQLYKDQKVVVERWRSQATVQIDAAKGEALAKLDQLEQKCWHFIDLYETGRVKEVTAVTKYVAAAPKENQPASNGVVRSTKTKNHENVLGLWLRQLQWCIEQRCRIYGLYAPVKIDGPQGSTFNLPGSNITGGDTFNFNLNVNSTKSVAELTQFPVIELDHDSSADAEQP